MDIFLVSSSLHSLLCGLKEYSSFQIVSKNIRKNFFSIELERAWKKCFLNQLLYICYKEEYWYTPISYCHQTLSPLLGTGRNCSVLTFLIVRKQWGDVATFTCLPCPDASFLPHISAIFPHSIHTRPPVLLTHLPPPQHPWRRFTPFNPFYLFLPMSPASPAPKCEFCHVRLLLGNFKQQFIAESINSLTWLDSDRLTYEPRNICYCSTSWFLLKHSYREDRCQMFPLIINWRTEVNCFPNISRNQMMESKANYIS